MASAMERGRLAAKVTKAAPHPAPLMQEWRRPVTIMQIVVVHSGDRFAPRRPLCFLPV